MKTILPILFSLALAVSALAQTRNVLVGTNDVIISPSNFWGANSSNARTGLGLGTAATNPASAFQPASVTLSNFATSGIVGLANGGTGATNATTARANLGATTFGGNLFTLTDPSAVSFLRINANNTISALSASDFRTAIGVGTGTGSVTSVGLTAPAIFTVSGSPITSSGTLSLALTSQSSRNFFAAPSGGGTPAFRPIDAADLPAIAISGVTGLQAAIDSKLSTTGTAALATNVTGVVGLANGGTGGTNAATARAGLGGTTVGSSLFTLLNPSAVRFLRINADNTASQLTDSDFRTAIGLGTAATNAATAFQPASANLTNLAANNGAGLTNLTIAGVVGLQTALDTKLATNGNAINLTNFPTVGLASNVSGVVAITNGGSGATTAGGARTNLGLGETNDVTVNRIITTATGGFANPAIRVGTNANGLAAAGSVLFLVGGGNSTVSVSSSNLAVNGYITVENSGQTRTNLGLGWSALTNSNTGTGLVSVDTNGQVVSPTNFWQVAPITTTFIESQPITNSTTNVPSSRFLHIHSLAPNIFNVTNTIVLPTNGVTFSGDIALVVHQGPTNSLTRVRVDGSTDDLITMNRFDEAVEFVYYNGVWEFNHNLSFLEPIYFSGTNAAANAAASRTNLGLGATWLTNTNITNFRTAIELGATNNPVFNSVTINNGASLFVAGDFLYLTGPSTNIPNVNFLFSGTSTNFTIFKTLDFGGGVNLSATRTNLGLGATWLTNTNVTNFRTAIGLGTTNDVTFNSLAVSNAALTRTNLGLGTTNNVSFSNITASGTLTSTGAVTFVTNLNVGGAINVTNKAESRTNLGIPLAALTNTSNVTFQSAVFTTNAAPTNTANVNSVGFNTAVKWMEITLNISGTNQVYRIPLFQ